MFCEKNFNYAKAEESREGEALFGGHSGGNNNFAQLAIFRGFPK